MSLPALPSAQEMTAVTLARTAADIVAWANASSDVDEVRDAANKWAAITEYVKRTNRDGIHAAESAMRRLQARVGELLGQARMGGDRRSDQFDRDRTDLTKDDRHDFRQMAEHQDVVEQVIAESSNEDPPSRRKVMSAIREKKESAMPVQGRTKEEKAARLDAARQMAKSGLTSRQIAKQLGIGLAGFRDLASRNGIEVPADAVVGKVRHLNPDRIIDESIGALEGIAMGLALIEDVSSLDAEKRLQWLDAIREPLSAINRFHKELRG